MTPDYPQIPKATTSRSAFARETSVRVAIHAHPSMIWTLLTTAHDIARWTSTVLSLEGDIRSGRTIRLRSSLAPKRTFTLTVKEFVPEKKLVWGDGQGTRTFTLEVTGGAVSFSMWEKIGGVLFPLYGRYILSFDDSFEQFATDLKKESELIEQQKN